MMFANGEESEKYQSSDYEIDTIRGIVSNKVCEMKVYNYTPNLFYRANGKHFFGYRYQYKDGSLSSPDGKTCTKDTTEELEHQHCMNDIVLLPLHDIVAQALHNMRSNPIPRGDMIDIRNMSEFYRYNRKNPFEPEEAILVKNFTGSITWNPASVKEQTDRCFGYHLLFKLDQG